MFILQKGKYKVRQIPVGLSLEIDGNAESTGMYEIMVRRTIHDEYVLFLPQYDVIEDESIVDVDGIDDERVIMYITAETLSLGKIAEHQRLIWSFVEIRPESGEYYCRTTPVNVQFVRPDGYGFSVELSRCFVVNKNTNKKILYKSGIMNIQSDNKVAVAVDDNGVTILSGVTVKNRLYGSEAEMQIAKALFGSVNLTGVGAVSLLVGIVTPWQGEVTAKNFKDCVEKYLVRNTGPAEFNGNPQGSYAQQKELLTVLTLLWGPVFANYIIDEEIEICHVSYDRDANMFIPLSRNSTNLFQEFREEFGINNLNARNGVKSLNAFNS